ncbi:MAG: sialate O-acetylesterase [Planctomycetota bacterium]
MLSLFYRAAAIALAMFCFAPLQTWADEKPVQVFILAGQSNMVGHGKSINGRNPDYDPDQPKSKTNQQKIPGGVGSLRWAVETMPETYGPKGTDPLVDAEGDWLVRDDVSVYSVIEVFQDKKNPGQLTKGSTRKGPHTVGFGKGSWNGPEYGFGHVVGNAIGDDVLIIKVATGGTSLYGAWRSPTAVKKRGGEVGYMWPHMLSTVKRVLNNLDTEFPEYADRDYEIVGFGWHQGFNDTVSKTEKHNYGPNLVDFIADVRSEYGSDLPFVIGTTSMFPADRPRTPVETAQLETAKADPLTAAFDARPCWRDRSESPSGFGYHWNHNGVTHYLIGAGMAKAYLDLVSE